MIVSFADEGTRDLFNRRDTKAARRVPRTLWRTAQRKLDQLDSVARLEELGRVPGNRLEKLAGYRKGQYSIRVNDQYRVCFEWSPEGPDSVEITDYH